MVDLDKAERGMRWAVMQGRAGWFDERNVSGTSNGQGKVQMSLSPRPSHQPSQRPNDYVSTKVDR